MHFPVMVVSNDVFFEGQFLCERIWENYDSTFHSSSLRMEMSLFNANEGFLRRCVFLKQLRILEEKGSLSKFTDKHRVLHRIELRMRIWWEFDACFEANSYVKICLAYSSCFGFLRRNAFPSNWAQNENLMRIWCFEANSYVKICLAYSSFQCNACVSVKQLHIFIWFHFLEFL